ncbi:hemolymph lipopolysaccharide-binding protein-like [Periplaneta americana]|uniref:hemolymph lipopolysaccharide-binding protein-like n=1 Tax=Periplaneta americana TaxID=6978 RepID=UPI0037E8B7AC
MAHFTVLLLAIYFFLCAVDLSAGQTCSSTKDNVLKFSVSSHRNLTGHWIAQLQMEHSAAQKDSGPWVVDIDHETAKCKDGESIFITATVRAPPQRPGPDYELVPELGYYKMYITGKTWTEARDICAKDGGHLLILNSELEAGVARSFWRRHPKIFDGWKNDCAYIGIHDEYIEGEYITILGTALNATGYTKWAEGEPAEGTSGNSGCVGRNGLLFDTNGMNTLAFFCEQEL